MAVVLDSDAVVGFLDQKDALHDAADEAIRGLASEQRLLVSVVTYAEVLTGALLGYHEEARVQGFFTQLVSSVLPVDMTVADKAAELRSQLKALRMPDALVLATAEMHPDVDLLVTGDAQAPKAPGLDCTIRLLR